MSPLTWIRRNQHWSAGRYRIDLKAPGRWVCSEEDRTGEPGATLMTARSLGALKARVESLEARRRVTRRALIHGAAFLSSILLAILASGWGHAAAPAVEFLFIVSTLFFAIRTVLAVSSRSWDLLPFNYQ